MKKIYKALMVIIIVASSLMPFNVFADDYTTQSGVILGVNVELINEEIHTSPGSNVVSSYYVYKATFILDDYYTGYLGLTVTVPVSGSSLQFDRTMAINGNTCSLTFHVSTSGTYGNTERPYIGGITYTVKSHNIQKVSKDYYVTYQQTSAYEYFYKRGILDFASDVENTKGLPFNTTAIKGTYTGIGNTGIHSDNYFTIDKGQNVVFGFMIKQPTVQVTHEEFYGTWRSGTVRVSQQFYSTMGWDVYVLTFIPSDEGAHFTFNLKSLEGTTQTIIPIYLGLDNAMSDELYQFLYNQQRVIPVNIVGNANSNIDTLTNGTSDSNNASDLLDDNNDQMASDMDDMADIENQYNQDLNNQLNNIDFSNPVEQNAGILPAANFVINIFNGLINNNPLSILIIICCILLIGKKVIGK